MIDMRLHSGRFVSLGKEDSPSVTLYSKKKTQGKRKKKKALFQIYSSAYTPQNGTQARCRRWRGRQEQWSQHQGGGETGHPERVGGSQRAPGRGGSRRGNPRWELASAAPSPPSATSRAGDGCSGEGLVRAGGCGWGRGSGGGARCGAERGLWFRVWAALVVTMRVAHGLCLLPQVPSAAWLCQPLPAAPRHSLTCTDLHHAPLCTHKHVHTCTHKHKHKHGLHDAHGVRAPH